MELVRVMKELYGARGLVSALVTRHLATRYRGSVLGFFWTILNPLCLVVVYTLVFKYFVRFDAVEHYSVFVLSGLLPWIWMTSSLFEGTSSIVSSGHLITKSMFPPQVLPCVAVLTNLINYLLSLPVLLVAMLVLHVPIGFSLLFIVPLVVLCSLFLFGILLTLSALNVRFRDIQHLLGNAITLLFFLSPVVYPMSSVPENFRWTVQWNPLGLFVQCFHSIVIDGVLPSFNSLAYISVCTAIFLIVGSMVFNANREKFAEYL
jgi:lipopolysaccharide transport system permease protein